MKKLVFTVITNGSDELKEPTIHSPGWDYVCFTDDPNLKSTHWDVQYVNGEDPKKLSRYVKTHPPDGYDLTLYLDATFRIRKPLDPFALSKTEGIWLNAHPQRQCTYEEAKIVIDKGLDKEETATNQVNRYKSEGLPEQWGLWRCGILVRDSSDEIKELNELWWKEISEGTWRDQVSFPYACWKSAITPNSILHGITNIYFKQSLHSPKPTDEWKFVGEGEYDPALTERYQGAHLIILKNGLLFPSWISNYISLKDGKDRFIELIKILQGVVVHG